MPTLCVAWVATQRASGCAAQSVSTHLQQRGRGAAVGVLWATTGGCKAARGGGGAVDVLKVCADIVPISTCATPPVEA